MPACLRCKRSEPKKVVCFRCYKRAIEEITLILQNVQQELLVVTAKAEFLQNALHSKERNLQPAETKSGTLSGREHSKECRQTA